MTQPARIPRRIPDVKGLAQAKANMPDALRRMGWPSLRPGQDNIIWRICSGLDTIGLLPTAQGKSATYLIPCLVRKWKVLVFSPLLALMKDQAESACRKGIKAARLSGDFSDEENASTLRSWANGDIEILYSAPERMKNEAFIKAMKLQQPDLITVDEAHVIVQWGDTFRASYAHIGSFIRDVCPRTEVISALTATATEEVEEGIRDRLNLQHAAIVCYMPRRKNLHMSSSQRLSDGDILPLLERNPGSTIVYCATQASSEELAAYVGPRIPRRRVSFFHGGLVPASKDAAMDEFMKRNDSIMFSTNAFGMGIDKENIRAVIHYEHGKDIESVVQEYGRAGRDGLDSWCHSFLHDKTIHTQRFLISTQFPPRDAIESVFAYLRKQGPLDTPIQKTAKDISVGARTSPEQIGAVMQILDRFGVIDKAKTVDNSITVTLVRTDVGDPKVQKYASVISSHGKRVGLNKFQIDKGVLARTIGLAEATVLKYLRDMSKEEAGFAPIFELEGSFRGNTTRLKKDSLADVDFGYMQSKFRKAVEKLDKVVEFLRLPDREKPDFIDEYFKIKRRPGELD